MGENNKESVEVTRLVHELYFKVVLFVVVLIAFICLFILLIWMFVQKYPSELILICAGADGLIGVLMRIITKSLFKANKTD